MKWRESLRTPSNHTSSPNNTKTENNNTMTPRANSPSNTSHEDGMSSQHASVETKPKTCCFCWCCCCSCSCLNVKAPIEEADRPPLSNDSQTKLDPHHLVEKLRFDDVKGWGESFDDLMSSIVGQKLFREFLKMEYSEENIMFWLACDDLKKEENPDIVEEKARLIYEDFISILSPKEVSLDSRVREIINKNMIDPNRTTFDEAQIQIYKLMHQDSYPRFLNSRLYKDALVKVQSNSSYS